MQFSHSQVKNEVISSRDSVIVIGQLVKEHLVKTFKQAGSYHKPEQNRLNAILKDSALVDSFSKQVLLQIKQLKNTTSGTGRAIVTDAFQNSKQLLKQHFNKVVQTKEIESLFGEVTGFIKQRFLEWNGGNVSVNGQIAPSLFNNGSVFINSNTLNGSWSIMGIPIGLQLMRQDLMGAEHYSRNTFSFQFDREAYMNSLREKVKLKFKAKDLLPDYNDALQNLKQQSVNRLKSSLDSINKSYKGKLGEQLGQLGDVENLINGDIKSLQDKLLSAEFLSDIESKKNQLIQLQNLRNQGGAINQVLYDSLLQSAQSIEGVNTVLKTISSFKDDLEKSGVLEKLKMAEQFKSDNIQQWLQNPDKLKAIAKEQLNLSGMQKLFLNMNQLKAGMNTVSLSPLTVYQYTNNGVNAEFVNNKNYLFIMAGKQKEFGNLLDFRFANSLFSMDNNVMGIRVGKGDLQSNHSHLSFFSYKQNKSSYNNNIIDYVPGATVVATLSNQLKINETNFLNIEISKSTRKYSNEQNIFDSLQTPGNLSKQVLSTDNFGEQLAVTLQWNGEIEDQQLSYSIQGTRIGKGYSNPGSVFLSRAMTEVGGSVKKSLLKNKLQFSTRGNYRQYEYGNNDTRWRNYNFSFQGKWKLKKGQFISLRYQPYQSLRWQDQKKYTIVGSNRLSLDGSVRRRFGKVNYQNVMSISALKNNYEFDSIPVNNRSVLISSLQTISINRKSYYLNIQYNKTNAPSALAVFNTQFNSDAGIMYSIAKGIIASTAINYNSTKGWFRQVGIKQSISGNIGERFIISFYTDILKNIKEYRPNNMDNIRLDWSLNYSLK
jgi:hypothetical protein